MSEHSYPDYLKQKQERDDLTKKVIEFKADFDADKVVLKTMALRSNIHKIEYIARSCRERTKDYCLFNPFLDHRQVRDIKSDRKEFHQNCHTCPLINLYMWCPALSHLETGNMWIDL